MREVLWTKQAQADLAAIRAFISQDSPHYASVIVSRLIAATDLDWTIVPPSQLNDGPLTGKYRFGERLKMSGRPAISRADTAQFILRQLHDTPHRRKVVIVSH